MFTLIVNCNNLISNPTINYAKSETLHHTLENKLDVEIREAQAKIHIKPEKKVSPQAQNIIVKWLAVSYAPFRQLQNEERRNST